MTRTAQWRDLGRPESALIGVQYIGNDGGEHRGAVHACRHRRPARWIFDGTGLEPGRPFGRFGIEIDHTTPYSPAGHPGRWPRSRICSAPGKTAQMSYYETRAGAKVFAAGAFTLAGAALWPSDARVVLENLWQR